MKKSFDVSAKEISSKKSIYRGLLILPPFKNIHQEREQQLDCCLFSMKVLTRAQ